MKTSIKSIFCAISQRWPLLLIGLLWCWFFWPLLNGTTVVGFRDSSYLYYPLFQWIDSVWASGEIPLWNPFDNFGMPVVADGSSCVFYPGKLIFLFRFLSFESRYGLFIGIHVLLAATATFTLAKSLRCKNSGAALAAVSYSFGGSLLFQTTNVIYLISAAWLPFAILGVWKIRNNRNTRPAIATGFVLAMMVLGGDPQMVYHVGLLLTATLVAASIRNWTRHRWRMKNNPDSKQPGHPSFSHAIVSTGVIQLFTVVGVTAVLAAVQLLPTFEWSQNSVRKRFESPRNVYELYTESKSEPEPELTHDSLLNHLVQKPAPDKHADHIYQFSQPPWTIMELAWPNIAGMAYPTHQRWYTALPGNERMWTPSIYVGCVTLLLALISIRLWGPRRKQVWISRWTLFFGLASFGWFGMVWLINELFAAPAQLNDIAPQVGGFYWMMVVLLPKYVMFRYPAKLFVIASLGICLLAGVGFDQLSRDLRTESRFAGQRRSSRYKKLLSLATALVCGSILLAVLLTQPALQQRLSAIPADLIWGPFDLFEATVTCITAASHTTFVMLYLIFATCLCWRHRMPNTWSIAVLLVVFLDIGIANYRLVPQVPASTFTQLAAAPAPEATIAPAYPQIWMEQSSPNRLSEVVQWQRENQFPKWHLLDANRSHQSFSSIESSYDAAISANAYKLGLNELPLISLRHDFLIFDLKDHQWRFPWQKELVGKADAKGVVRMEQRTNNSLHVITETNQENVFLCTQEMMSQGWKATIVDLDSGLEWDTPIVRWLGVFRAVEVPTGRHRIEFRYEPAMFYWGAAVSLSGAGLISVLFLLGQLRHLGKPDSAASAVK